MQLQGGSIVEIAASRHKVGILKGIEGDRSFKLVFYFRQIFVTIPETFCPPSYMQLPGGSIVEIAASRHKGGILKGIEGDWSLKIVFLF